MAPHAMIFHVLGNPYGKKYETNLQSNEDAVKFCLLLSSVCLAHDRQNELRFILINSFLVQLPYKIHVYKKNLVTFN